ncbi:hypothetical protein K2173_010023 [Erythroxylum novogranatense]|uniref:Uncharacterized protein n=1 Tax=Erythroxylum novogranatense TaxID=1862640 RepID=A0AAV8S504_9ROSI|nr:hypothetical protein K2173_010023 [Erythroxylum novogranatense]
MSQQGRQQGKKLEVYSEVLRRLEESKNPEANFPSFEDQIWAHFNQFSARYALEVNVERVDDVLIHKRLLHLAHDPANRWFYVHSLSKGNPIDSVCSDSPNSMVNRSTKHSLHPPPTFGSSPNLEALALGVNNNTHSIIFLIFSIPKNNYSTLYLFHSLNQTVYAYLTIFIHPYLIYLIMVKPNSKIHKSVK